MKLDNFAITMYQTCPAKYQLRMVEGWDRRRKSGALGFGGALHAGLATWYSTHSVAKALESIAEGWDDSVPIDDYRTKEKCIQVMLEYVKHYPAETWKPVEGPSGPMIECPFTIDTGMTTFDGEPIEYGGIFDGLVDFNGQLYCLEHKSTSRLGAGYFNQFKPNNQVTGYIWAAEQMSGRRVHGAIINAIGVYKVGATRFERQPTSRNSTDIETWLSEIRMWADRIRRSELTNEWPRATGACTLYGLCEFHQVHSLSHAAEQRKLLDMDYVINKWDYEKRGGTEVVSE